MVDKINYINLIDFVLQHPQVQSNDVSTAFIEAEAASLTAAHASAHPHRFFQGSASSAATSSAQTDAPAGTEPLNAPVQGVLVSLDVQVGDSVAVGQQVAIMEAMKMEFVVKATQSGIVRALAASPGDSLFEGSALLYLEPAEVAGNTQQDEETVAIDHIRADLQEVLERRAELTDERRPEAVAKRRKTGQRTARENLADLLDDGSFIEYGGFALAAQRSRRTHEELLKMSPADGLINGIGTVNADKFGEHAARCMALSYDYTVFAGTQGVTNPTRPRRRC